MIRSIAILIVIAFFSSFCPAESPDSLVTKFEVGKTYHQTMTMEQHATTPAGEMKTNMVTEFSSKVTAGTSKDTTQITMTYDAMKLKSSLGNREVLNYDSTDTATAAANTASLSRLLGKEIGITLDHDNQVTKVTGMDALTDDPVVKQLLNQNSLKELMSQSQLLGIPDHPVAKGESWEFTKSMLNPMIGISVTGKYSYEADAMEEGNKLMVFTVDGKISSTPPSGAVAKPTHDDPKAAELNQNLLAMDIKLTHGKMKGKSYFDPTLKFLRRSEVETEMTLSMKNPQTGERMELPSKQSVTLKLTSVEDSK